MSFHRTALALLAALAVASGTAWAQETTGTITGRVVDAQGLAVPGVTVTAIGPQGETTAVTNAEGQYTLPFLTPGTYTVRARLTGFKNLEQQNVTVTLGQTTTLPLRMEVGGVEETVSVVAAPPAIDTTSTTVGAVIGGEFATTVPLGRRISDLTYMAPGVQNAGSVGDANPSIAGGTGLDNQ
jgi:hypothetical protein